MSDKRILGREWEKYGLCDQCWASVIAGQGVEILQAVVESEGDPVAAAQARERLVSLTDFKV